MSDFNGKPFKEAKKALRMNAEPLDTHNQVFLST
jgi:hypothetical protein